MIRKKWLLAAVGMAGSIWNGANADDPPFRASDAEDRSAIRRATDFFSRGGKTTTDTTIGTGNEAPPKRSSLAGAFDPRLRPKPNRASSDVAPVYDAEDDVAFGSATEAPRGDFAPRDGLRQRPRMNLEAVGASSEESGRYTKARTPSGETLQRGMSDDEASSSVVHAQNEESVRVPHENAIQRVSAEREPPNPFVPVEEFLKGAPSNGQRTETEPAESRPGSAGVKTVGTARPDSAVVPAGPPSTGRGNVTAVNGLRKGNGTRGPVVERASASEGTEPATSSVGVSKASMTSDEAPRVTVRWARRSEISVGQPCECELIVENHSSSPASDIVVEAYFPSTVRLISSQPEPSEAADHLTWKFATLSAEETQSIRIGFVPSQKGELATMAQVRFTGAASGAFQVTEPLLELQLKGPKEVLVGDPASHIIVVSNPGTGAANNVVVEALIPKGLEHPRGEKLVMDVGSLGAGESRTVRLALSAVTGGQHQVSVTVKGESGLQQAAVSDVLVVAPSVKLALDGPSLRYIGRNATYQISVLNDGAAPSNNVRVMHKVPEGFKFVRANKGGTFDETAQTVSWFVGRLEPGQNSQVVVELSPLKLGAFVHRAGAISEQGAKSDAELETVVDGTAALQLEVVEQADPIEVGSDAVYEIRLKNAGSKAAQNVGISCEMTDIVALVSANGPSEFLAEKGLVVFKSLPSLPAGKTVVYRVTVKGVTEGNHRFRVRLASDSITEPLISEELTKFYAE